MKYTLALSQAIIQAGQDIGSITNLSTLWADAVEHLSGDSKAVARLAEGDPDHLLRQAYRAVYQETKDPIVKRDALTFLAAVAIHMAMNGVADGSVAALSPDEAT
jgi:hypothetical protein